jgi:hypothetical protein
VRRTLFILPALLIVLVAPAQAGSVTIYPSWWQTEEADEVGGLGLRTEWNMSEFWAFELGAQYYEELTSDPIEFALEGESPGIFEDDSISAIPVELGLRFDFGQTEGWDPYVSAGGAYFVLDSDFGNLDDEFGYFASLGSGFGDQRGADFFAEVQHRWVDGTIEDIDFGDDIDTSDDVSLDLQGWVVNMGVKFNFGAR